MRWSAHVCVCADSFTHHFHPPQRHGWIKGVCHLTLAWSITQCLSIMFSGFTEHVRQKYVRFSQIHAPGVCSWRDDAYIKHLKRDFGLWAEGCWGNPGHCDIKWVPVVSSECKGFCIPLVCTAWSTLLSPLNTCARIICCFETNLRIVIQDVKHLQLFLNEQMNANEVCLYSHHVFHLSMNLSLHFSQQWPTFGKLSGTRH